MKYTVYAVIYVGYGGFRQEGYSVCFIGNHFSHGPISSMSSSEIWDKLRELGIWQDGAN